MRFIFPFRFRLTVNGGFLVLAAITCAFHFVYLYHSVWPQTGTRGAYEVFFFFYNEFFNHCELPRWLPYGLYGVEGYVQHLALSFSSFFFIGLGKVLGLRDIFAVFGLSLLFEHLALLLGMYLLSRELFENKAAVYFTCLGIILSAVWIYPIHVNFRIYFLMPMVFYFLVKFVRKEEGHYFWMAGVITLVSVLGSTFYYIPYYSLLILLFLIIPVCANPRLVLKIFERTPRNVLYALLCTGILVLYLIISFQMKSQLAFVREGRDTSEFVVPLRSFLTHGMYVDAEKFLGLIFAGPIYVAQRLESHTMYLGLTPFVFIFFALLKVRRSLFWAFVLVTAFVVTFSLGGRTFVAPLTYLVYYPIRFFRSIGVIGGILKPFLLILAGYGLDALLTQMKTRPPFRENLRTSLAWILANAFFFGLWIWADTHQYLYHRIRWPWFHGVGAVLVLTALFLSFDLKYRRIYWGILIVCLYGVDLGIYQKLLFHEFRTWRVPKQYTETRMADEYYFQPIRVPPNRIKDRSSKTLKLTPRWVYAYNYLYQDPCAPEFYIEFLSQPVFQLFFNRPLATEDRWILRTIGCVQDYKIRLNTNVQYAASEKEADSLIKKIAPSDPRDILYSPLQSQNDFWPEVSPGNPGAIDVIFYSANRLELTANVRNPAGAWLVWADSYHPQWKAYVDGKVTPVSVANLAFKAVPLPFGVHRVRFVFREGFDALFFHLTALLGAFFGIVILGGLFKALFVRNEVTSA